MIRDYFSYNEASGNIVWLVNSKNNVKKKGKIAGCKNSQGYIVIRFDGKLYLAHRIAWYLYHGKWPDGVVDHKNRIRCDNRICNLHVVDKQSNNKNMSLNSRNTSGVNGVSWSKQRGKWLVTASKNNKTVYLGAFADKELAEFVRTEYNNTEGFSRTHGESL